MLVNIGCGATWHPAWNNLDVRPLHPEVRRWDAGKGLPFRDGEVDACYASHVLEHLTQEQARTFLRESYRVLRAGGIIRLAVPDLEGIAREYLRTLEGAEAGDPSAQRQHRWMTLELLDQLVRDRTGGDMERYLRTEAREQAKYVMARIGQEAKQYMEAERSDAASSGRLDRSGASLGARRNIVARGVRKLWSLLPAKVRRLGQEEQEALRIGRFRMSGECHRWMYDRLSLRCLLEESGFAGAQICTAFHSGIPGFADYQLDVADGLVRKPDSLFMEATKR